MQKNCPPRACVCKINFADLHTIGVHRMQLRYLHPMQPNSVQVCKVQFAHFAGYLCIL